MADGGRRARARAGRRARWTSRGRRALVLPPHWMQGVARAFPSTTDAAATSTGCSRRPARRSREPLGAPHLLAERALCSRCLRRGRGGRATVFRSTYSWMRRSTPLQPFAPCPAQAAAWESLRVRGLLNREIGLSSGSCFGGRCCSCSAVWVVPLSGAAAPSKPSLTSWTKAKHAKVLTPAKAPPRRHRRPRRRPRASAGRDQVEIRRPRRQRQGRRVRVHG